LKRNKWDISNGNLLIFYKGKKYIIEVKDIELVYYNDDERKFNYEFAITFKKNTILDKLDFYVLVMQFNIMEKFLNTRSANVAQ